MPVGRGAESADLFLLPNWEKQRELYTNKIQRLLDEGMPYEDAVVGGWHCGGGSRDK